MTLPLAETGRSLERLQSRISVVCQAVRWLAVAWLGWLLYLILSPFADLAATVERINKLPTFTNMPITAQNLIESRMVSLFVWGVAALIGIALWRLMSGYLKGDIFSEQAALRLKRVGQAGLLTTLLNAASRPLSMWLLSPALLQDAKAATFFVPDDLLYLLISALILSLASVYRAAAEINAENKQFV